MLKNQIAMKLFQFIKTNTLSKALKGLLLLSLFIIYASTFPFLNKEYKKITEIYYAERMSAAQILIINKFNKIHEGKIKVIPIDFPNLSFSTNERKELLARSLRGRGDGIDLVAVDFVWVQRFAKWCEPLGKYFSETQIKEFIEPPLKSCYYEGNLVAIPFDFVEGVLYYREDLLKQMKNGEEIIKKIENNITWEKFIELKNQISCKNPYYIFPADNYEGLICCFVELVLSQNKEYFNKNNFNLNTVEAAKALQLLVDLVGKYGLTPRVVTDFTEIPSYKYFMESDGLFIRGWPTYDKDFINTPLQFEKSVHLRKAPIPHFQGDQPAATFGGWNLMIPKFSTKKKETLIFVKYLLSEEAQEILYKESGYFPVLKKFYEDSSYLRKYPELIKINQIIMSGVSRPQHEEYTRFSEIMSYYFKQAILGQISVKKALQNATDAIQSRQVVFAN